jgi:hypothetical protein
VIDHPAVKRLLTTLVNITCRRELYPLPESFARSESVLFWPLPAYIDLADRAGLVVAVID